MAELTFTSTAELKVGKQIIEQVIGQDEAVEVIKKAANQRRHVLLIGEPGTGKSLLGMGLAELLPKEKLVDVLAFPNPNDENKPLIRTVPAGKGRDMVNRARLESFGSFKNQNILFLVLAVVASLLPYYFWRTGTISDVIYAASLITGMVFIVGVILMMNIGKRMDSKNVRVPKIIVDNFGQKQAPFDDATGAHAGALLGDVQHDPFQCYSKVVTLQKLDGEQITMGEVINQLFQKYSGSILRKKERNYEAIFLSKKELSILGETCGSISPVEVLSCNRQDYDGTMIKLTTSEHKELIVTPEHKIAVNKNGEIVYVEARHVREDDEVVANADDIIIDEYDVISTYDKAEQEQAKWYNHYLELKARNPLWGYKRISKSMGQKESKCRWWHAGKHIPISVQTVNWLKERGLLPLRVDNPKLLLITKVLGATFGDGGIFRNLNGIFLSSSNYQDTKKFSEDLQKIFGNECILNDELREGGEYGHSWCLTNTNRNIIRFFIALGAPLGNKTTQELKIPHWIKLKVELQDEFYGSLFGSELGVSYKYPSELPRIEFAITGLDHFKENRLQFLGEVIDYLGSKSILITHRGVDIQEVKTEKRTEGNKRYRCILVQTAGNLQNFMEKIKINYCNLKQWKLISALDMDMKEKLYQYLDLRARGLGAEAIMKKLEIDQHYLYRILNNNSINLEEVAEVVT